MWLLKYDDSKAEEFKRLIYKYTDLKFVGDEKLKYNVPEDYKECYAYHYFTQEKVEEYMIAKPDYLLKMHEELYNNLQKDANGEILETEIKCIESVLSYKRYISQNKEMSYALAKLMDSNTCTYCNRVYTLTVSKQDDNQTDGEDNNEIHLIRPEFDHWYPQSKYPDLALSYYNLIPSCHYCNSNLKRDTELSKEEYIHPYLDDKIGFHFAYVLTSKGHAVVVGKNQDVDDDYFRKVQNTLDLFEIKSVYDAHSDLELKDLMVLAKANPRDYIFTLVRDVALKLGIDEQGAYRILFGTEGQEEKFRNRPMSKFKSDIIKKIKEDLGEKS